MDLSFAVLVDGHVVRRETEGAVTPRHRFHACSISKFVAALATLHCVGEGLLDLDADVNRYLSTWKMPARVTLRQLLGHRAGLVDPADSFGPDGPDMDTVLATWVRSELEPGARFEYSDAGYCVIQRVIEEVSGQPYENVAAERVLAPLGMVDTGFEHGVQGYDQEGRPWTGPLYPYPAAAGLWSTPTDLCLAAREVCRPGRVLTPALAAEMLTGLGLFRDGDSFFSLGWGVAFQCMLVAHPGLAHAVVVMLNRNPGVHQAQSRVGAVVRQLREEYHWSW